MSKPLYDFLVSEKTGDAHFHMPSHRGRNAFDAPLDGAFGLDYTDLYGCGSLYDGCFPIAESELKSAKLRGVKDAFFLTNGATQGIFSAMLLIASRTKKILIDRACHRSVYNSAALLGLSVEYILNKTISPFSVFEPFDLNELERRLSLDGGIGAVVITSPTYYGVVSDIRSVAEVCRRHNVILLVDEAHGAHLPFCGGFASAVSLGADIGVSSLHKTLVSLGQAALITSSGTFSPEEIRRATAVFGTSSPSYAILASIDLTDEYMAEKGADNISRLSEKICRLRKDINGRGVFCALDADFADPLKLLVCTSASSLRGYDAARILEDEFSVFCEMADFENVLFIISPADTERDIEILSDALLRLEAYAKEKKLCSFRLPEMPKTEISLCEAIKMRTEKVLLKDAPGRICGELIYAYPPDVPVLVCGELISRSHVAFLSKNGFSEEDGISVLI